MRKLIYADVLIKAIPETRVDIFENCRNCSLLDKDDVISIINNLPSAERHGHWVDVNSDGSLWKCSVCGETQCCKSNYCGDCGAKIDEVEDDDTD